jgi:hypothetical protein
VATVSILRVFPRRTSLTPTDGLAQVGDPQMFPRYGIDEVHVSVCFSWDMAEGERLAAAYREYYPVVRIGGPAYGDRGDTFTPGQYVRQGVVFTSRGCPRHCSFCLVPAREGPLRLLPITEGNTINDNNFLACPREHRQAVYEMLARQSKAAVFAGGIDARLVTDEIAAEFRGLRISELFLACDSEAGIPVLQRAAERLAWLGIEKLRCFVLVGYGDDTPEAALRRLEAVWQVGVMPFAQFYRPPTAERRVAVPAEWRALVHTWSRPAAVKAMHTSF